MRHEATVRSARRPKLEARGPLVALDSDGTVMDSMRPKHEYCFLPAFASRFGAGAPYEVLAEVWRFVNLRSRSRGLNRYRALGLSLRLLAGHPRAGGSKRAWLRVAEALEAWLAAEPSPSRGSLDALLGLPPGHPARLRPALREALEEVRDWSRAVDAAITVLAPARPFPAALAGVPRLAERAELVVLSAAPGEAIREEWLSAGLLRHVSAVKGQESGTKAACLAASLGRVAAALAEPGPSAAAPDTRPCLVVGDALGDLEAARQVGAVFFPIIAGREGECWKLLLEEGLPAFLEGHHCPAEGLIAEFLEGLAREAPWARSGKSPARAAALAVALGLPSAALPRAAGSIPR